MKLRFKLKCMGPFFHKWTPWKLHNGWIYGCTHWYNQTRYCLKCGDNQYRDIPSPNKLL